MWHGANVTALHLAANNGHTEAALLLLEHGADPTLREALYGSDPAGWAEHFGHRELAQRLRDAAG